METNLTLVSPKPVLGLISPLNPTTLSTKQCLGLPLLSRKPTGFPSNSRPRLKTTLFAFSSPISRRKFTQNNSNGNKDSDSNKVDFFASTSSSTQHTSVGVNPQPYAPPPSQFGSPLFWIGVGVGFSALFTFVASRVKQYAMQQAFKTMMGQMGTQNSNQFSNMNFPPSSPFSYPPPYTPGPNPVPSFPYPPPPTTGPSIPSTSPYQSTSVAPPSTSTASTTFSAPSQAASEAAGVSASKVEAVDVSASKLEAAGPQVVENEAETKTEAKKSAFVDVSPEETLLKSPFEDVNGSSATPASPASSAEVEVVQNGAASYEASGMKEDASSGKRSSILSVEALEKMMDDPTVQKMVYPHLPEEMRNPTTFKWMMQNPVYRQQLQEMLDNMAGNPEWDSRMVDTLKNFDLNSPDVKQQFDQLGVTPEEVISKIMSNPDLAKGFQNPRVQQAMMDCSQNPWNIAKYQNDKEVMDVINQLSQLFPAQGGPPPF